MGHTISREGWRPTITSEIKYGDAVRWCNRVNRRTCLENFGIVQKVEDQGNGFTCIDIKMVGSRDSLVVAATDKAVFDRYEKREVTP